MPVVYLHETSAAVQEKFLKWKGMKNIDMDSFECRICFVNLFNDFLFNNKPIGTFEFGAPEKLCRSLGAVSKT